MPHLLVWMTNNRRSRNPSRSGFKLTARLSLTAYDAIAEIQRRYRRKTGRALPLWKVLDAAIIAYAKNSEAAWVVARRANHSPPLTISSRRLATFSLV